MAAMNHLTIATALLLFLAGVALGALTAPRRSAEAGGSTEAPSRQDAALPPRPQGPPTPPLWYRLAWQDAQAEIMFGRPDLARPRSARLVAASTHVYGAEHTYTRWALDQYAAAKGQTANQPAIASASNGVTLVRA
ncbi:hypothetical protein [Streptomyces sp. NRRL B-24484]|uniref:hypothetical protein n=1 Tax=Streptomyces sp. NRRL B-24484 TaxID=1463833 RepID=UPI0004BFEB95|nr:hypothetical protein [Streptomyces sp. NRRL B-24484]